MSMLQRTFCHIKGVSVALEQSLWAAGVRTWDDYLETSVDSLPPKTSSFHKAVHESKAHLSSRNSKFFTESLNSKLDWRVLHDFQDKLFFFDIETLGLRPSDSIVTIASYKAGDKTCKTFVLGRNLEDFPASVPPDAVLVSFNGRSFDLPRIDALFQSNFASLPHVDLQMTFRCVGLKGGFKAIEKHCGLVRPAAMADVGGEAGISLWKLFEDRRDERFLEALLAYNVQDVLGMVEIVSHAFNMCVDVHANKIGVSPMQPLIVPANPFKANRHAVHAAFDHMEEHQWLRWNRTSKAVDSSGRTGGL